MIKELRRISPSDDALLCDALKRDQYHEGTKPEFFYAPGSLCNLYSDEQGPVVFVRGTKALRLDMQFIDNDDDSRNGRMLMEGFPGVVAQAKAAGFTELVFTSNSPKLIEFCKDKMGFKEESGDLRLFI